MKKKYLFWFAENGAAAPGAGQMSYLWKVKLEKRNDIFWLRDKETNSIQTYKEEIGGGCRLWKNTKTYPIKRPYKTCYTVLDGKMYE